MGKQIPGYTCNCYLYWNLKKRDILFLKDSNITSVVLFLCTSHPDLKHCIFHFQDGKTMLWDLNEGKHLYTLDSDNGEPMNALVFSPNRYWLCAATGPTITVWVSTPISPLEKHLASRKHCYRTLKCLDILEVQS